MADRYPCPLGRPCGTCGSAETYSAQVTLRLNGKDRGIDPCVAPIVRALNDAGIRTMESCCGHGVMPAGVLLEDGRELLIVSQDEAKRIGSEARENNTNQFRGRWFLELYATLPDCSDECGRKATYGFVGLYCDECRPDYMADDDQLPWAHIVREQEGQS